MSSIKLLLKTLKEKGIDFDEEEYIAKSHPDDSKCKIGNDVFFILDTDAIQENIYRLSVRFLDNIFDCVENNHGVDISRFLDEDKFISWLIEYVENLTEGCTLFVKGYDYLIFKYPDND